MNISIQKTWALFKGEYEKFWQSIVTFYPDYVGDFAITLILFLGLFYAFQGNGIFVKEANPDSTTSRLIGFIVWYLAVGVINESSVALSQEKQEGTLEQLYLTPFNIEFILVVRSLCWLVVSLGQVSILFALLIAVTGVWIPLLSVNVLFVLGVILIGIYGFGYFLAGLTLLYTKTASFSSLIQYVLLFFAGTLVPLQHLPYPIQILAKILPLSQGLNILRQVIVQGALLTSIPFIDLLILIVQSAIYFTFGLFFFYWANERGRERGIISHY